jgi:hypothetical protein
MGVEKLDLIDRVIMSGLKWGYYDGKLIRSDELIMNLLIDTRDSVKAWSPCQEGV